jgi:hypothetical protein
MVRRSHYQSLSLNILGRSLSEKQVEKADIGQTLSTETCIGILLRYFGHFEASWLSEPKALCLFSWSPVESSVQARYSTQNPPLTRETKYLPGYLAQSCKWTKSVLLHQRSFKPQGC